MTPPSKKLRDLVYRRDNHRCVACGSGRLSFQHRAATGMGGRGSKAPALTASDGLTLCPECNAACEAGMQAEALLNGWKVKRFSVVPCVLVPVWYPAERSWYQLNGDGSRDALSEAFAAELRGMAGTLPTLEGVN